MGWRRVGSSIVSRKPKASRAETVTRHPLRRGDWVDLPAENSLPAPTLPAPPDEGWAPGTLLAWAAWWSDPASLMWGPSDLESLRQLVILHHGFETDPRSRVTLAREVRQRQDDLGLSIKGKTERRWRVVPDEVAAARTAKSEDEPYADLWVVPDVESGAK